MEEKLVKMSCNELKKNFFCKNMLNFNTTYLL